MTLCSELHYPTEQVEQFFNPGNFLPKRCIWYIMYIIHCNTDPNLYKEAAHAVTFVTKDTTITIMMCIRILKQNSSLSRN